MVGGKFIIFVPCVTCGELPKIYRKMSGDFFLGCIPCSVRTGWWNGSKVFRLGMAIEEWYAIQQSRK